MYLHTVMPKSFTLLSYKIKLFLFFPSCTKQVKSRLGLGDPCVCFRVNDDNQPTAVIKYICDNI